ncbi:hypothetical protein ABT299_24850 [Spirillospora sp. NPDC000708]
MTQRNADGDAVRREPARPEGVPKGSCQAQLWVTHAALPTGYQNRHPNDWIDIPAADPYLPGNLAWLLPQADRQEDLAPLLIWLSRMHLPITTAGLPDLISDYTHASHPHAQAIRRILMKSTPVLTSPGPTLPAP